MHLDAEHFLNEYRLYRFDILDLSRLCAAALSNQTVVEHLVTTRRPFVYFNIYTKDFGISFVPEDFEENDQYKIIDLMKLVRYMAS